MNKIHTVTVGDEVHAVFPGTPAGQEAAVEFRDWLRGPLSPSWVPHRGVHSGTYVLYGGFAEAKAGWLEENGVTS